MKNLLKLVLLCTILLTVTSLLIAQESVVEAVVLGSAQDGGVPHAGCYKDHCEAARNNPNLRRRSPSVALIDHGEKKIFVLDAGPDFDEQLEDLPQEYRKGRNPVDGIFLTHGHIGHYTGLMFLSRPIMATEKLPVYCSASMAGFLRTNGPWSLAVELGNIELIVVKPWEPIKLTPNLTITPVPVPHRNEITDTLAFIANGPKQSLLYMPDIDRWEKLETPVEKLVQQVDYSLLDASFYSPDELPGRDMSKIPHPLVVDTMNRLQQIVTDGLAKVIFIHLNHSNLLLDADGVKLKELRERGFEIADDGMTIAL